MIKKSILLMLMFIASPAHGMVYTWTDSTGIRHYTNKEYEVPARYRARAKALYPEQADKGATSLQNAPATQVQPPVPAPQARPDEPSKEAKQPVIAPLPRRVESASERARQKRVSRTTNPTD